MPKKIYLVSACLLGLPTRYDGGHNRSAALRRICRRHRVIPVCPEQLGGLPTPRRPAEIRSGDGQAVLQGKAVVVDDAGADVTMQFLRGALAALRMAQLYRVDGAILKSGSPSCGTGDIRDLSLIHIFQISPGPIGAPKFLRADLVAALSPRSLHRSEQYLGPETVISVSYTHLDVYKRQTLP